MIVFGTHAWYIQVYNQNDERLVYDERTTFSQPMNDRFMKAVAACGGAAVVTGKDLLAFFNDTGLTDIQLGSKLKHLRSKLVRQLAKGQQVCYV